MRRVPCRPLTVKVPIDTLNRIPWLMELSDDFDVNEHVLHALRYYDRALCATHLEHSEIVIRLKDGRIEDMTP